MITENQYQKLLKERSKGCGIEKSAMRSGMSEKTENREFRPLEKINDSYKK